MSSPQQKITETSDSRPDIPENVEIGDFIVGRYTHSEWARNLFWENWHHAALISQLNPLKVIEATGISLQKTNKKTNQKEIREGVVENEFEKTRTITLLNGTKNPHRNLWRLNDLIEVKWLKPVFPNPIREIAEKHIKRRDRKIITEDEARQRAVAYGREQIGDPFKLFSSKNSTISATKWDENEWYCSLLIYKAFSRTVTDMYLESYSPIPGFWVTPEDLIDSRRSIVYHHWKNEK